MDAWEISPEHFDFEPEVRLDSQNGMINLVTPNGISYQNIGDHLLNMTYWRDTKQTDEELTESVTDDLKMYHFSDMELKAHVSVVLWCLKNSDGPVFLDERFNKKYRRRHGAKWHPQYRYPILFFMFKDTKPLYNYPREARILMGIPLHHEYYKVRSYYPPRNINPLDVLKYTEEMAHG